MILMIHLIFMYRIHYNIYTKCFYVWCLSYTIFYGNSDTQKIRLVFADHSFCDLLFKNRKIFLYMISEGDMVITFYINIITIL